MKSRSAVSPILGVVILIGITIAGGMMLSNISSQFYDVTLSEFEYTPYEINFQKDQDGDCYVFVGLENSGSESFNQTKISVTPEPLVSCTIAYHNSTVLPHEKYEKLFWFSNKTLIDSKTTNCNCTKFSIGKQYSFTITGNTNSSQSSINHLVKVNEVQRP